MAAVPAVCDRPFHFFCSLLLYSSPLSLPGAVADDDDAWWRWNEPVLHASIHHGWIDREFDGLMGPWMVPGDLRYAAAWLSSKERTLSTVQ